MFGRETEPCPILQITFSSVRELIFFTDFEGSFHSHVTGAVGGVHEVRMEMLLFLETQGIMKFVPLCRSNDIISVGG